MKTATKVEATPGPWEDGPSFTEDFDRAGCCIYHHSGPIRVLVSHAYGTGESTARANARLIAAAPELLEALEQILSDANSADYEGSFSEASHIKAKEAINKARGL